MLTVERVKNDPRFVTGQRVRVGATIACKCKSTEGGRPADGSITRVYPWVVVVRLDNGREVTVNKKEFFVKENRARFK